MKKMAVAEGGHAAFSDRCAEAEYCLQAGACGSLIHSGYRQEGEQREAELVAHLWLSHSFEWRRLREGGEAVAGEREEITCTILSPGCRAEAAGPSCCTLVTKIPYKSKWYTVRTTQGHDGLESLPFSFSSHLSTSPTAPVEQKHIRLKKICQCSLWILRAMQF